MPRWYPFDTDILILDLSVTEEKFILLLVNNPGCKKLERLFFPRAIHGVGLIFPLKVEPSRKVVVYTVLGSYSPSY